MHRAAFACVLVFASCGDDAGTPPDAAAILPDAPFDAPPDAPPDAAGLSQGAMCGGSDGGPTLACAGMLECCAPCCLPTSRAVCTPPVPLSTDAGAMQSCPLPDLEVNQPLLASTVTFTEESFDIDSCEIMEGCVEGPGMRKLVRFSVETPNLGTDDFALGDPQSNPQFMFSQCHNHYHLRGYARYRILDAQGQTVVTSRKQAFCLLDTLRIDSFPGARLNPQFDCSNQGISLGWSDIYPSELPCQFIDITNVPAGDYQLEVTVNPDRIWPELGYGNNTARVPIHVEGLAGPNDTCARASGGGCPRSARLR